MANGDMEWSLLPVPGIVSASEVFRQKDEGMQKKSERRTKYDRIVSPGVASCLQQRLLKKSGPKIRGLFSRKIIHRGCGMWKQNLWNKGSRNFHSQGLWKK